MRKLPNKPPEKKSGLDPEKPHWSKRAKAGVIKTLDFMSTYAPALLATTIRVVGFATLGATMVSGLDVSFIDPHVAGFAGAVAIQGRRILELLKDMKEYIASSDSDDKDLEAKLEEKEQMIGELYRTISDLTTSQKDLADTSSGLAESLESVLQANQELSQSNDKLKEALRVHYSAEIKQGLADGTIEKIPFDFDETGSMVGYVYGEEAEVVPKTQRIKNAIESSDFVSADDVADSQGPR
jgi:regulator of replication initiation timing